MKHLLCFLALFGSLLAQDILELPRLTVSSATAEVRLESPVLGDPASFLDTPRAYSSLDRELLDLSGTTKIGAFQLFDASTQSTGQYGHVATVNIRGDMAELYQNGQRRTNNAAGFQPSLNGAEQVDLIKGAAPVVFGPGFYSGGYLNMQTKRAGSPQESYGLTLGTLSADHDYLTTNAFFDITRLAGDTSYRLAYEGQVDRTFYSRQGGRDDKQDVYLAVHRGNLDLFIQHTWQASPQIEGINHPSQYLIDHPPAPTDNLVSPGDFSNANVSTVQAIYARAGFRSYTLAEYVDRRRFNAFAYQEWATQFTLDQRVEWHHESDLFYTIVGAQARYEYRESYTNYFNAFFDAYDLTNPAPRTASTNPAYVVGHPGPDGYLFFGPLDGNADTTLSDLYQAAAFVQQRIRRGDWQVLYGARADGYRVFVTDPLTHSISDNLTTYSVSGMASLIRVRGAWSTYLTYARLYSVNGTVSGGGIVFAPDLRINESNLRSLNRLYEVGLRYEGKVRFGATLYQQDRQQPDLYAYKPNDIQMRGVEVEVSRRWGRISLASTATYNEGHFVDSLPFEFAPTVTQPGDYRIPGLSRFYATSTVTYHVKRWTTSVSGRYQSEQAGNALVTYSLPAQYTIDAAVQYRRAKWDVTLNVGNLTNEFNYQHNGDSFGDNAVIHHEPLRNATLTLRFHP